MNILLLEDRGVVAYPLKESLERDNHTIFLAPNISRAKTYWCRERIDCVIADLNMDPEGLKPEEKKQTINGLLSGWIWLRNYVFPENESMKKQTIILTAYLEELRDNVKDEELEGIALVGKDIPEGLHKGQAGKTVLDHVKNIAKVLEDKNCEKEAEE